MAPPEPGFISRACFLQTEWLLRSRVLYRVPVFYRRNGSSGAGFYIACLFSADGMASTEPGFISRACFLQTEWLLRSRVLYCVPVFYGRDGSSGAGFYIACLFSTDGMAPPEPGFISRACFLQTGWLLRSRVLYRVPVFYRRNGSSGAGLYSQGLLDSPSSARSRPVCRTGGIQQNSRLRRSLPVCRKIGYAV
jgi:hypothetical protein